MSARGPAARAAGRPDLLESNSAAHRARPDNRASPYEPAQVGHEAIGKLWRDEDGVAFTMRATPVAVEGDTAVVHLDVRYQAPEIQEYRDLWVLRFAADGRVNQFEEWSYWPELAP